LRGCASKSRSMPVGVRQYSRTVLTSGVSMTASPRRVGAETSKTRDVLLDCVERLMSEDGYASVTYRAVAAKAGVTPSLVQYYFPTLDDIFVATIRRRTDRNVARLTGALEQRTDDPLRVLWEYSWAEATGALMTEFMALGNHRKSIRAEIAEATERVRRVQLHALTERFGRRVDVPGGQLSPGAMLLLITGMPKFLNLEEGIGVETAHGELVKAFDRYLGATEPRRTRNKTTSRGTAAGKQRRPKRQR
jgi:TetR/AcrR family transcriptional repressor of nem operon